MLGWQLRAAMKDHGCDQAEYPAAQKRIERIIAPCDTKRKKAVPRERVVPRARLFCVDFVRDVFALSAAELGDFITEEIGKPLYTKGNSRVNPKKPVAQNGGRSTDRPEGRRCLDMNQRIKSIVRPVLFTLGGALVGLAYYALVGCQSGTCAITSSPIGSMLYMGLIGWLLSGVFGKGRRSCSM